MDLLLLAPEIQEEVLFLPEARMGRDAITLKQMRAVCAAADWETQGQLWVALLETGC